MLDRSVMVMINVIGQRMKKRERNVSIIRRKFNDK